MAERKSYNRKKQEELVSKKIKKNVGELERIFNYVPKTDRDMAILNKKQKELSKSVIGMFVYSIYEGAVNELRKYKPEESVPTYLTMRDMRHDAWVEMFNVLKTKVVTNLQGDVRVNDVIKDIELEKKAKGIPFNVPPISESYMYNLAGGGSERTGLARLTPDIMFYDRNSDTVVIGDVAVTRNVQNTEKLKTTKYEGIVKYFKNRCHIEVLNLNFVVSEDQSNIDKLINKWVELGYMSEDEAAFNRYKEVSHLAHTTMTILKRKTDNIQEFHKILEKCDKIIEKTIHDINLPNNMYDDIEIEQPIRLEHEILVEMKKQVSDYLKEKPFDNTIDDTKQSFKIIEGKLLERIKEKPELSGRPKESLKFADNSYSLEEKTDYALLNDYISDITMHCDEIPEAQYILNLLPTSQQVSAMEAIYKSRSDPKVRDNKIRDSEDIKVYGAHQYLTNYNRYKNNYFTAKHREKIQLSKKNPNIMKEQEIISPESYTTITEEVEEIIKYYGSVSKKPSFLDSSWDAKTDNEFDGSKYTRKCYDYVRSTNGVQLANTLSNFFHRTAHITNKQSNKDNIFVANNGSFIGIIFKEHTSIKSPKCQLPFLTITRIRNNEVGKISIEYDKVIRTEHYTYLISKLCRMPINKINNFDAAGYKLVATASYVMSLNERFYDSRERIVGIMTLLMLDQHQKTSKLLDLMKYISFMPFAEISMLPELVVDKFDLLFKTRLDIWLFRYLQKFIDKLSDKELLQPKKRKVYITLNKISTESLGIQVKMPSFYDMNLTHENPETYVEEINSANMVRSKMLYGGQFMDKSLTDTLKWNNDYVKEIDKFGDWVINGRGKGEFPVSSEFAFDRDLMLIAQNYYNDTIDVNKDKLSAEIANSDIIQFMHYRCSLRGCTKAKNDRGYKIKSKTHFRNKRDEEGNDYTDSYDTYEENIDLHTTSLDECLKYYKANNFDDKTASVLMVANHLLVNKMHMEVAMSPKEQRGDGRPIATGTLFTKAAYYIIERPEAILGKYYPTNVVVENTNKLKEMCETYKSAIVEANTGGKKFKYAYQITEDQKKFSENDNTRKYEPYINNNFLIPRNVRRAQLTLIRKNVERRHMVHTIPKIIRDSPELLKWKDNDEKIPSFKAVIGWPQGMLNSISTNVHAIADYYITRSYNICYPDNKVHTKGLVHSDDSWLVVCCNDLEDCKRFMAYRILMKRRFCLKLNIKKLWGSSLMGELVSNYNMNGNVHYSIVKQLTNSFGSLNYKSWAIDVSTQISALQQSYRNGADLTALILLSTILRQQLLNSYQVKPSRRKIMGLLPVELGGYPDNSPFELAVTGVACHNNTISAFIDENPEHPITEIVLKVLEISTIYNTSENLVDYEIRFNKHMAIVNNQTDSKKVEIQVEDFNNDNLKKDLLVPTKSDIFSCIKYVMPKTTKVARTINNINSLNFESNGLEMIVTRPKTLSESLGNLKKQTHTMLYQLAADNYSSNIRLIAIAQSVQSAGKTVKIHGLRNMTYEELLETILKFKKSKMSTKNIELCLSDDSNISDICYSCVHRSELVPIFNDKRKIINKLPYYDDKFSTVCKLKDVLLRLIDISMKNTDYYRTYCTSRSNEELIDRDVEIIKKRFNVYFSYYDVRKACNLIMQNYENKLKVKLWTQPRLRNDTLDNFISDLYGRTICQFACYSVLISVQDDSINIVDQNIVETIYSMMVINKLYDESFQVETIFGKSIPDTLKGVDYSTLNEEGREKHGILMLNYLDNHEYIQRYDSSREFFCEYITRQKYQNGKWVGRLEVLVKFGETLMEIKGEAGNVEIVSNTVNMKEVLKGMYMLVNKCFKSLSYDHFMHWGQSKFWESKRTSAVTWLSYFSPTYTHITSTKMMHSIPFTLDTTLKGKGSFINMTSDHYSLDEFYRKVYKKVNDVDILVLSTSQNLRCPYKDKLTLKEAEFCGNLNTDLVRTGAIFKLTLEGRKGISYDVADLLLRKNSKINNSLYVSLIANAFNSLKTGIASLEYVHNHDQDYEKYIFDIQGQSGMELVGIFEETTPEDISAVEMEYKVEERFDGTALCKINNTLLSLTGVVAKYLSEPELDDFFKTFLIKPEIKSVIMENIDDPNTFLDFLDSQLAEADKNTLMLSYIYINRLDTEGEWPSNLVKYLEKNRSLPNHDSQGTKLANKVIDILNGIGNPIDQAIDDYKNLL